MIADGKHYCKFLTKIYLLVILNVFFDITFRILYSLGGREPVIVIQVELRPSHILNLCLPKDHYIRLV